jgi:Flp pilus assembly CpaF family ATPase
MDDEQYLSTRREQQSRERSDLELALGERFWQLLDDDDVREINIRPNGYVWYQRVGEGGGKFLAEFTVEPEESEHIAHAILQQLEGKYVLNEDNDYANCKMLLSKPDEFARVHIVSNAATADGGYGIMIRKHSGIAPSLEDWVAKGYMTKEQAAAFRSTVDLRLNTVICAAMFAGKSTLLNTRYRLTEEIDPTRSVAYIQDVPETVCALKDRMALMVTKNSSYQKHCHEAFRQSVQEVSINELRDAAAYDLIHNLWLSGHNGGATTLHAHDEKEAMWRIGTLIREAGVEPQPDVIASAVHVLVFLRFNHQIGRKVTKILRVKGARPDGTYVFEPMASDIPWPEERHAA